MPSAYPSMLIALVQAVVTYLNLLQADSPGMFPLPFNCIRRYDPVTDFTDIPSSASPTSAPPTVYVFPHDDPEDRNGLNQAGFEGDFEIALLIVGNVGQPNPLYLALLDSLMSLRQSLREVLRPQNAIGVGSPQRPAVMTDISTAEAYDKGNLQQGIFTSLQIFKFHLPTVIQQ